MEENAQREDSDGVYDFPLFSKKISSEPSNRDKQALQRIVLRSPTPNSLKPGFLESQRSHSYYFTGQTSKEKLQQYQQVATSDEDIRKRLHERWVQCTVT